VAYVGFGEVGAGLGLHLGGDRLAEVGIRDAEAGRDLVVEPARSLRSTIA
jgi:hypothetical protein